MTRALAEVSFRDPVGFVYWHEGDLRRQVNLVYREHYDRLMDSGLYDELVEARLLIPHEELADEGREPGRAYITLASKMLTNQPPLAYWTQGCRK